MHYYKRHLGDYAKKAGHLSPLEHGVYTLILDSYYDREKAPTLQDAMRWARARTEDEKQAVMVVLQEFFSFDGEKYFQKRVDEELAAYHDKAETNRVIAVQREQKKRERKENEDKTIGSPVEHDSCTDGQPNHKPLTINQEPLDNIEANSPSPKATVSKRKKKEEATLSEYLQKCKEEEVSPVPREGPVFEYIEKAGIPEEFLTLAWMEMKDKFIHDDKKKYKDWQAAFLNYIKNNWLNIWYIGADGNYVLTTKGQQAKRIHEGQ